MSLIDISNNSHDNPVDLIEHLAASHDWSCARSSEDEVTLVISGQWADYQVSFTWMGDIEALHLACAFDLKVPERRRTDALELVTKINEQLWIGHFDMWFKDGLVMFRHALVLTGGISASSQQCESLLSTALTCCERYFQTFQFVVWAGKTATEALDATLFETSGEA